uniref:HAT C-terminal dimerisation domain-containing protein n=1 Tax=Romanomermis culicivorax TaxID=13658 RepID=A0A915I0I3_ROMCU
MPFSTRTSVTTANNKRVFSNLRYVKSYLRSTMCQPQLNGLMMLSVYDDAELCIEKVIDDFAIKNRRCKLNLLAALMASLIDQLPYLEKEGNEAV